MYKDRRESVRHSDQINENNICMFCTDLALQPVICEGPCRSVSCRKCASNWYIHKQGIASCPKKCSTPWRFKMLPQEPLQMACPYSNTCLIPYLQDFPKHILQCPYQPPEMLQAHRKRKDFLCANNHKLQFFISTYAEMVHSNCSECGEREVIKSHCAKCNLKYCIQCRMPLCTQSGCPLGHTYTLVKSSQTSCVCDICGMAGALVGLGMYEDRKCNFDVCQLCYQKLPKGIEQNQTLKYLRASEGDRCFSGHPLTKIPKPSLSRCLNCDKDVVCWKECKQCKSSYCLNCKKPMIYRIQCEEGHEYVAKQSQEKCMMCNGSQAVLAVDKECNLSICGNCFKLVKQLTNEKSRMMTSLYCLKGHAPLFFVDGYNTACGECKEKKCCRLVCPECEPLTMFCSMCKMTDFSETCYYGDQLKKRIAAQKCTVCEEDKEVWECRRCNFYVCKDCKELSSKKCQDKQANTN